MSEVIAKLKINEGGLSKIDIIVKLETIPVVTCFLLVVVEGK